MKLMSKTNPNNIMIVKNGVPSIWIILKDLFLKNKEVAFIALITKYSL